MSFRPAVLLALTSISIFGAPVAFAQTPVQQSWTGWAQCQLTFQSPGYSHQETHLWTITGSGTRTANVEIYPTSWTVTGGGSIDRTTGPTRVTGQWTVNGTLPNVTIGTTLHADRITIQRWTNHGPARSGLIGSELRTVNGQGRPAKLVLDVQQWTFPATATGTTSNRANGSTKATFDGARGPLAPAGTAGAVICTWDYARGNEKASPPPSARDRLRPQ